MKTFKQLLIELNACNDAKKAAGDIAIEEAISQCDRGDWLGKRIACKRQIFAVKSSGLKFWKR